jgi:cytochrome c-type biogenesis protein CcmH
MDENRYRPVELPPKSSTPSMSAAQRDALEHRIHCQCGCNLDVYTCRTTDFSCSVSPSMHRDVMTLVEGGYSAPEIIDAFVHVYGERVLMAPKPTGFNITGWVMPFAALGAGGALVITLLRRWRTAAVPADVQRLPTVDATPEELARLEALVKTDDR